MNPVPTILHLFLRFISVLSSLVSLGVLRGLCDTCTYHLMRLSLFGSVQAGSGAQPASHLMGTRGYFPEVRALGGEVAHSSPPSTVATVYSRTSTSPICLPVVAFNCAHGQGLPLLHAKSSAHLAVLNSSPYLCLCDR